VPTAQKTTTAKKAAPPTKTAAKKATPKTFTVNFSDYADPLMGGIAWSEVGCVLISGPAPTTPKEWRQGLKRFGHTNDPEAAYAHAIAAGILAPKDRELHVASKFKKTFKPFEDMRG
jgi:hypothetical protein